MASTDYYNSVSKANTYGYTASMKFVFSDGDTYDVELDGLKSIVIDSDYVQNNMPMLFISCNVEDSDRIIREQDSAIVILDIKKCIYNSDMQGFYTDYISDKFIYMVNDNANNEDGFEDDDIDNDFDTLIIGLLSLDHVNKNKKDINCVLNGKLSSAMYYVTGHLPILIEPPKVNIDLKHQVIPPMNSVSKTIAYLNNISVFYPTKYRFFIDFDCAYLISSSGKAVPKQGDLVNTVIVNLKNAIREGTKEGGMWVDESGSMYIVEIDGADCDLYDNHVANKSYTKINAINTSGSKSNTTINYSNPLGSVKAKTRNIRVANNNDGLASNLSHNLESGAVQIMIQKTDTDSSVFTINKEYEVRGEDVFGSDKYDGKYILVRKRELYIKNGDNMRMNVMLLLERAPD